MRFPPSLLAGVLALLCATAQAQAVPGGAQLGMTPSQLQQAVPALKRVPHPARLAGGLVGGWSGATLDVAGVPLTPTYFFADGELRRVEYLAADASAPAFEALRQWARVRWGAELGVQDPGATVASWSTDDIDIYLQQSHAQLRLVVKQRVLKDADEL